MDRSRYTRCALTVLTRAGFATVARGLKTAEPEQILLGLVLTNSGGADVLAGLEVDTKALAIELGVDRLLDLSEIDFLERVGEFGVAFKRFDRFTPEAEALLDAAGEEAAAMATDRVATEHLLLGALRVGLLADSGVSLAEARERVVALPEPENGWEGRSR